MKNFTYYRPATLPMALPLLSDKWVVLAERA